MVETKMKLKNHLSPKKKLQLFYSFCVILIILISTPISYIALPFLFNAQINFIDLIVTFGMVSLIKLTMESILDNYALAKGCLSAILTSFVAALLADLATYFFCRIVFGAGWQLVLATIDIAVYTIMISIARITILYLYRKQRRIVTIIGPKAEVTSLAKKFFSQNKNYFVVRFLFFIEDEKPLENLHEIIKQSTEIYLTPNLNTAMKDHILLYCIAKKGIEVFIVPSSYEIGIYGAYSNRVDDILTFQAKELRLTLGQKTIKRLFDIFCSMVGLIIFWPVMIIIAIIVHAQDGGPSIFKQERITLNHRKFLLYKFRSMKIDAEKVTGAVLSASEDDRITHFGKFIRMTHIDELPQLWNVFIGNMSFVGPRPEREMFVNQFLKETPQYQYRLNVKAGITGFAQTYGKYDTKYQDKLRWDLLYIRKYNSFLDLQIIFHTIVSVFTKNSSRGITESQSFEDVLKTLGKTKIEHENYWELS